MKPLGDGMQRLEAICLFVCVVDDAFDLEQSVHPINYLLTTISSFIIAS